MADTGEKDADLSGNAAESFSKEAVSVMALLAECGVAEYDPRVVSMLMDIQFAVTSKVLQMASGLSRHEERPRITAEDVLNAADVLEVIKEEAPQRERILQLAIDKNLQPLPQIRHNYGLKLPNDRFCQLQQNVEYQPEEQRPKQIEVPHHVRAPPHIIEPPTSSAFRPDAVQNMLKRRAPDDDFDA